MKTDPNYKDILINLTLRNLSIKYKGSVLGFFWAFLGPILTMAILSFVFSRIMRIQIEKYPLGGSGFAKEFMYYNPLGAVTHRSNFTHNGYLYLPYRFGIPIALCFILPLFFNFFKSLAYVFREKDIYYRIILLGSGASLLMVLISNLVTTTFLMRDGTFVIALSYALIGIAEERMKNKRASINTA